MLTRGLGAELPNSLCRLSGIPEYRHRSALHDLSMRTKKSTLPSAKPQIALLAMALVLGSGAVYAQAHRGQVSAGSPTQARQATQTAQSGASAVTSSFRQPAKSASKVGTFSHSSSRPQIAGGAHGENDGENGDD